MSLPGAILFMRYDCIEAITEWCWHQAYCYHGRVAENGWCTSQNIVALLSAYAVADFNCVCRV